MFTRNLSLTRVISKKTFGVSQIRSLSLLDTATSLTNDKSYISPSLTKIVATIGPTSEQYPVLKTLVTAGLRIMRINFSHATYEEADLRVANLRKSPGLGQIKNRADFNLRAVLLDTQGPEIRTGSFPTGTKNLEFTTNDKVTLTTDDRVRSNQSKDILWISYKALFETISTDTRILLDDGAIELSVDSFNKGTCEVFCTVVNSGTLGNKKGVNLPGEKVLLPAMSQKDKEDIKWGIENDIDYIAASFVRKPSDVTEIRDYVKTLLPLYQPENHPVPLIISKIESVEALLNFDEILKVSDGIMVARGDLGVEIPMETLTMVQKEIVRKSNLAGKPVIVATQMLESMQKNPRPTRAECTDVSNAVFDGADCVMLSGESAQGKYPYASVKTMKRIIKQAESWITTNETQYLAPKIIPSGLDIKEGMAYSVAKTSKSIKASCIIVLSKSGNTAKNISKFRPDVPIITYVPTQKIGRLLQMYRGVVPVVATNDLSELEGMSRYIAAVEHTRALGHCNLDDNVIIVAADKGCDDFSSSITMRIVKVN